jgi:cis-3-alkyl-4-acyloxetan-2-one decarboxylase
MQTTTLVIDGVEILMDGDGPHTVLMQHGWPDTHRLWDNTVNALKTQHRCVRFTLPGFNVAQPARATSLSQMCDLLTQIIDTVSPGQPVTLLLHDWGCIFGYEFAACHTDRVARIVAVDIGDHNAAAFSKSLSASAKLQIVGYQLWLALAYTIGSISSPLATRMTRWMAKALHCRTAPAHISWQMNYPYAMQWLGTAGGFGAAARVDVLLPTLYVYGARKPFMFHSPRWLEKLAARPDCAVQPFDTGHWVMVQQPQAFVQCVGDWLAKPL